MGFDWIPGDWRESEKKTKQINMIEPVIEGSLQLFFQTIVLYSIVGPGQSVEGGQYILKGLILETLHNTRRLTLSY